MAIRLLESLEWLERDELQTYRLTDKCVGYLDIPKDTLELLCFPMVSYVQGTQSAGVLQPWIDRIQMRWNNDNPLLADFLDGMLFVPLLLALHSHVRGSTVTLAGLSPLVRNEVETLFMLKNWAQAVDGKNVLTAEGQFLLARSLNMGVTASYAPMLARLPELLFGAHEQIFALQRLSMNNMSIGN